MIPPIGFAAMRSLGWAPEGELNEGEDSGPVEGAE